jgi:hypothetical protein
MPARAGLLWLGMEIWNYGILGRQRGRYPLIIGDLKRRDDPWDFMITQSMISSAAMPRFTQSAIASFSTTSA